MPRLKKGFVTIQHSEIISNALQKVNNQRNIESRISRDDFELFIGAYKDAICEYLLKATKETGVLVKMFDGLQIESTWHDSKPLEIADKKFNMKEGLRVKAKVTNYFSTRLGRDKR